MISKSFKDSFKEHCPLLTCIIKRHLFCNNLGHVVWSKEFTETRKKTHYINTQNSRNSAFETCQNFNHLLVSTLQTTQKWTYTNLWLSFTNQQPQHSPYLDVSSLCSNFNCCWLLTKQSEISFLQLMSIQTSTS